jgi:hypothetical protein
LGVDDPTAVNLANHIRWKNLDGVIYVLDLANDLYLALDPELTERWVNFFAEGTDKASPSDAIFTAELERRGWLVERPLGPGIRGQAMRWLFFRHPVRSKGPLLTLRAWWCLLLVTVSLRTQGLWLTYQVVRHIGKVAQSPSLLDPDAAIESFLKAERFFITGYGTNDCLPRSLALYAFLSGVCNIPAEHHIGIERFPFTAHSWTSIEGVPCVDSPARLCRFSALSTLPG